MTINVTQSSLPPFDEFVEAIRPLWESRWLTNMGAFHRELEERLREFLDVPWLSLMVNGHLALELAIQSFGFPEGAEVITTPFTFISTTHAIVRNRLRPVFCDVRPSDGCIDTAKIEEFVTEHTVAIVPVHVYGSVCDVVGIQRLAEKFGLKVIYDAAHAFGVRYKGRGIGSFGDASIFSFHATKVYNTIEGGAVAFGDPAIYDKLYNLKNFGIKGEELVVSVGANAKMNELCAAMGLCNLRRHDEVVAARARIAELYRRELAGVRGIRMIEPDAAQTENFAYFPIFVEDDYPISRDELHTRLRAEDINARKYFYPLTSDQACFKNKYKSVALPVARRMADQVLVLPNYEALSDDDAVRVAEVIKR